MIAFRDVSKAYDGLSALSGLNLEVAEGEMVVLIGPSGGGKSTALKLVNGLVQPTAGEVRVDGRPVADWEPIALRRSIGYVIQEVGLFPHWTVARNIGVLPRLEGWPEAQTGARVDELLELVGLDPGRYRERYPSQLSGGQAQRVGVARALALKPAILLMDEPFGALDPLIRAQLQSELQRILSAAQVTTLLVTHDLSEAFKLGQRVGVLAEGRLEQVGSPAELLDNPESPFLKKLLAAELIQVRR